jgi:UDP-N-acetylmuramoyl-L-alanyl-D-glutamate--2,6-diaminopimelate ligase
MILKEALEHIQGMNRTERFDVDILGISYDSRTVQKGDLFVAIKGEKEDGAHFIPQAIDKGAVAVASEQKLELGPETIALVVPDARRFLSEFSQIFYGNPAAKLKIVGITGTKGKTTTSYLMDSIYRHAGIRSFLAGTIEMKIGTTRFQSSHTTPESSDLMRFLSQAVTDGCTHGAMEVSSHSLSLKRVFGAKFTVGVFMNLTHDHLDFHKDLESYFHAKQLLFFAENRNRIESAVINTDDTYGRSLANDISCPAMRFGFNKTADIHPLEFQSRADSSDLTLETPAGTARFHMRLIGRPNAYNVMAAVGAALSLEIDPEMIRNGVESLEGVPGRMERIDAGQDFTVIVDYAHSPDSLENLLETVSQLPHKKRITVFGCGGDRDRTKRKIMGEIASNGSDYVFATSDNPRSENPLDILKEIESGLRKGSTPFKIVPDRRMAIDSALSMAGTGDVVVIAGKGHEDYQIIGKNVIQFDDRKLARELIQERMELKKQ